MSKHPSRGTGRGRRGERRGGAARAVFWLIALVVIGAVAFFIWKTKQRPDPEVKPRADELASYMAREHRQAWDPTMDSLFTVKQVADVHEAGKVLFGQDITFSELEGSGLKFQGGREAEVPGPPDPNLVAGRSAHFRLESDGSKGAPGVRASLFLQKYMLPPTDSGEQVLQYRTAYTLKKDPALGEGAPDIIVYRQGGLVYYLVADQPGGYDLVKTAFQIPDPIGPY